MTQRRTRPSAGEPDLDRDWHARATRVEQLAATVRAAGAPDPQNMVDRSGRWRLRDGLGEAAAVLGDVEHRGDRVVSR